MTTPFFDFADQHWQDMQTVSLAVDWEHHTIIALKNDGAYGAGKPYYGIYYGVPGHVACYSTAMDYKGAVAQAEWLYQNALKDGATPHEKRDAA